MNKLPNHTALKEWSNVVAALATGEQVILIRKGGLADPTFGVDANRFYLYPTFFHQGESEARPEVEVTHWCEVVRVWAVSDFALIERLAGEVVMPAETLATRYRFRPDQALYVIAVRTWRLARPARVPFNESYAGCRSWISIEDEIDIECSTPVMDEPKLGARIEAIAAALSEAKSLAV
jgi:hypothetical protein